MTKKISYYSLLFGSGVSILTLIIESLLSKQFNFTYTIAFIIGLLIGLFNLFLTDKSLNRLEFVSKPKIYYSGSYVVRFIIYGLTLWFTVSFIGKFEVFTCAFGMLFNKIMIYYIYLVRVPKEDNVRLVDELEVDKTIIIKLKENGFYKVKDITEVDRERLLTFLEETEVEKVINILKNYELFIKGELEVIIENDDATNV